MRRLALLLAIIASCLVICAGQNKPGAPNPKVAPIFPGESAWKELSSAEGGFSVLMPGIPVQKVDEVETRRGRITVVGFMLETDSAIYFASYSDLGVDSANPEDVKRLLDGGRDGMLSDKSLKLIAEKDITFGENPGREWLTENPDVTSLRHAYLVRGRMYQLVIAMSPTLAFKTPNASPNPDDRSNFFQLASSRFFDSFRLIESDTASLGEVDRLLRDLKKQNQTVLVIGSADSPSKNPITSDVINGSAVRLVQPTYPVIAHAAHASGQVSVLVLIDLDGHVAAAQAEAGHPLLRPAAIKAARESSFTPTKLDGKPVRVMGLIIYNFVAQ